MLTCITRTHIVFLADGTEALTIYERTPARCENSDQRTHTIGFPSRRVEPATPEQARDYARAWAEAAEWIEKRLTLQLDASAGGASPRGPCQ